MLSITPFLWFDNQAEEAMEFYASIFPNARKGEVRRAGENVVSVEYELEGQKFMALNGGPHFKFTEAVSFFVSVDTQQQVDELWDKLIAGGGSPSRCGWLKDRFGLSWQIVPTALSRVLYSGDAASRKRAFDAMMKMNKLDIAALERAAKGD